MVKPNAIKAILTFYLQNKIKEWGMTDDEHLTLPADKKTSDKISFLCALNHRIHLIKDDRNELLKLCDILADQEKIEQENHRSSRVLGLASYVTDYPFMACSLRAIRSYIMDDLAGQQYANKTFNSITAEIAELEKKLATEKTEDNEKVLAAKKNELETFKLINYHKNENEFLAVIKYKDKQFKEIKSFDDFFKSYCSDSLPNDKFKLLDRIYDLWHTKTFLTASDTSVSKFSAISGSNHHTAFAPPITLADFPPIEKARQGRKKMAHRRNYSQAPAQADEKEAVGFKFNQ